MTGVALAGSLETALLTISKLSPNSLGAFENLCTNHQSCHDVLNGPYATVPLLDVPLPAVGFVAYTAVALLCVFPSLVSSLGSASSASTSSSTTDSLENDATARSLILFLTSGMAVFSLYLMGVLGLVLHQSCPFCYASAALSTTLAGIAWSQRFVPSATQAFVVSTSSAAVTALASGLLFVATNSGEGMGIPAAFASTAPAAQVIAALDSEDPSAVINYPPKVTKKSSARALQVARRLQSVDAKMYGAFWCSHCFNQKQEFGTQVYTEKLFTYVECDKEGFNEQYNVCKNKKIPGFPTWEIKGKYYPGEKELKELENILDDSGVP